MRPKRCSIFAKCSASRVNAFAPTNITLPGNRGMSLARRGSDLILDEYADFVRVLAKAICPHHTESLTQNMSDKQKTSFSLGVFHSLWKTLICTSVHFS